MIIVIAALADNHIILKGKRSFVIAALQLSPFLTLRFHYSLVAFKDNKGSLVNSLHPYYSFLLQRLIVKATLYKDWM